MDLKINQYTMTPIVNNFFRPLIARANKDYGTKKTKKMKQKV